MSLRVWWSGFKTNYWVGSYTSKPFCPCTCLNVIWRAIESQWIEWPALCQDHVFLSHLDLIQLQYSSVFSCTCVGIHVLDGASLGYLLGCITKWINYQSHIQRPAWTIFGIRTVTDLFFLGTKLAPLSLMLPSNGSQIANMRPSWSWQKGKPCIYVAPHNMQWTSHTNNNLLLKGSHAGNAALLCVWKCLMLTLIPTDIIWKASGRTMEWSWINIWRESHQFDLRQWSCHYKWMNSTVWMIIPRSHAVCSFSFAHGPVKFSQSDPLKCCSDVASFRTENNAQVLIRTTPPAAKSSSVSASPHLTIWTDQNAVWIWGH